MVKEKGRLRTEMYIKVSLRIMPYLEKEYLRPNILSIKEDSKMVYTMAMGKRSTSQKNMSLKDFIKWARKSKENWIGKLRKNRKLITTDNFVNNNLMALDSYKLTKENIQDNLKMDINMVKEDLSLKTDSFMLENMSKG